jgi:hypothetical protein
MDWSALGDVARLNAGIPLPSQKEKWYAIWSYSMRLSLREFLFNVIF